MGNHTNPDWKKLLRYIKREQAALMLGPEVSLVNGVPLQQALQEFLLDEHEEAITYHYEEDGLFLFEDKIAKNDAAQDVRDFFESNEPDEKVYRMLAEMKFHLYVSMNPDTYLSDTLYRYGIPHRFNYFRRSTVDNSHQIESFKEVEKPTQSSPLIYNMLGSKNDDESLILDYNDVFNLVSSSTNPDGLPDKLRAALKKIRLFIFIGFPFERWYTQLLLRLLCGTNEAAKYAVNRQKISETTHDFLVHQFNIDFLSDHDSFLKLLYEQCKENDLLRRLSDPLDTNKVSVIKYVQNGEIERALDELAGDEQESTLLKARFNRWQQNKMKGTEDSRDLLVEYNKIVDTILETIKIGA